MSKLIVAQPVYFDGVLREVGALVQVDNPMDRKSLLERGIMAEPKAEPVPANKMLPPPANKGASVPGRGRP